MRSDCPDHCEERVLEIESRIASTEFLVQPESEIWSAAQSALAETSSSFESLCGLVNRTRTLATAVLGEQLSSRRAFTQLGMSLDKLKSSAEYCTQSIYSQLAGLLLETEGEKLDQASNYRKRQLGRIVRNLKYLVDKAGNFERAVLLLSLSLEKANHERGEFNQPVPTEISDVVDSLVLRMLRLESKADPISQDSSSWFHHRSQEVVSMLYCFVVSHRFPIDNGAKPWSTRRLRDSKVFAGPFKARVRTNSQRGEGGLLVFLELINQAEASLSINGCHLESDLYRTKTQSFHVKLFGRNSRLVYKTLMSSIPSRYPQTDSNFIVVKWFVRSELQRKA